MSVFDFPKAKLATRYGDREISATSDTHVYVGHPGYDGGTAISMPVRGVDYHVSAHLYKWSDGAWHIGPHEGIGYAYDVLDEAKWGRPIPPTEDENAGWHAASDWGQKLYKAKEENHGSLYASRRDSIKDASTSARRALGIAIEEAVNEWAKDAAPLLAQAEHNRLTVAVITAKEVEASATAALEEARDDVEEKTLALRAFETYVGDAAVREGGGVRLA